MNTLELFAQIGVWVHPSVYLGDYVVLCHRSYSAHRSPDKLSAFVLINSQVFSYGGRCVLLKATQYFPSQETAYLPQERGDHACQEPCHVIINYTMAGLASDSNISNVTHNRAFRES